MRVFHLSLVVALAAASLPLPLAAQVKPAPPAKPTPSAKPAPRAPKAPLGAPKLADEHGLFKLEHDLFRLQHEQELEHHLEFSKLAWEHEMEGFRMFELEHELAQLAPLPPIPPIPPFPHEPLLHLPDVAALPQWHPDPGDGRGRVRSLRPEQGTPEDSVYRSARDALNRGEYTRASTLFQTLEQRYPRSRFAPAALYYRAFALYRAGSAADLRAAVLALEAQQQRYPEAAQDADVSTLRVRVYSALAARGDQSAAVKVRELTAQGPTCDKDEMEVRAEALNALNQMDPAETRPTLKKVLARKDECSETLRRRAVYILGRAGSEEAAADLLEVAKNDPSPSVRSDAIGFLARMSGPSTVRTLEELLASSTDERVQRSVLQALRSHNSPEARRVLRGLIGREDVPERLRADAIGALGSTSPGAVTVAELAGVPPGRVTVTTRPGGGAPGAAAASTEEDAAFLRNLYPRVTTRTLKNAVLSAVARIGGEPNQQWLMGVVRNAEEEVTHRRQALSSLLSRSRRGETWTVSIEDLGRLYESLAERDLRTTIISHLGNREEPAATDKLFDIARTGTDPNLRRYAISALTRKNDPRTTKLLLEMVEKP